MHITRKGLIGISVSSGVLTALLILVALGSAPEAPEPQTIIVHAPAPSQDEVIAAMPQDAAVEIMVAGRTIEVGGTIAPGDVSWVSWPASAVPPGAMLRDTGEGEIAGSVARVLIEQGEPITVRRIVRAGESGFLAAILSPGMRAIAIPLESTGLRNAGGFIRPQDRVDLLVTTVGGSRARARTLMSDIRVLAVGQELSEPNAEGHRTLLGDTATVEVTPAQAHEINQAAKAAGSEISLSLRPASDRGAPDADDSSGIVMVRFGIEQ